jgi:RNA polymerase sigma-70 factor (ECF subfamily)
MTADRDDCPPAAPEPERRRARRRRLTEQQREQFHQLYEGSYRDLTRRTRSKTGNHHDAEDASSQAFLQVMETEHALDRPRNYLFRAAKHVRIDLLRHSDVRDRKQHLMETHFDEVTPPPEEPLMNYQREELLQRALDALPPPQKSAVTLSEFDGLTYAEIVLRLAEDFGMVMTERTVRRYVQSGLKKLRLHILSAEGERKEDHP